MVIEESNLAKAVAKNSKMMTLHPVDEELSSNAPLTARTEENPAPIKSDEKVSENNQHLKKRLMAQFERMMEEKLHGRKD